MTKHKETMKHNYKRFRQIIVFIRWKKIIIIIIIIIIKEEGSKTKNKKKRIKTF